MKCAAFMELFLSARAAMQAVKALEANHAAPPAPAIEPAVETAVEPEKVNQEAAPMEEDASAPAPAPEAPVEGELETKNTVEAAVEQATDAGEKSLQNEAWCCTAPF